MPLAELVQAPLALDQVPRSIATDWETLVPSEGQLAPGYDESKKLSLIQVIEHVFKEDEDTSAGFPVKKAKEFKVNNATKLALVTISGFEVWFGSPEQEFMFAKSREGVNAALESALESGKLTVRVRANGRRSNRIDYEWTWRCHVVIQCFG